MACVSCENVEVYEWRREGSKLKNRATYTRKENGGGL
jgi:hypothetical protein